MTKPRLVLDTNCIIDLEEDRQDARHIRDLIKAWKREAVDLAVVAVSASENQPDGTASPNFSVFEEKLKKVGLGDVNHLLPIMFWDFGYWDHALWSSQELLELRLQIQTVLFPNIADTPPTTSKENYVWRNQMCDTLVVWACIHHGWDCVVTRDKNFHDHEAELARLGLLKVIKPKDAVLLYGL